MSRTARIGSAWVLACAALAASACRSTAPAVEEFLLAPLPAALAATGDPAAAKLPAVRIDPLVPRGFLDRREIGWREGAVRAGPYHYKRWGEAPAEAVTRQLVELLRARGRFERVDATAGAFAPVRLRGELLALHEESAADGSAPHGVAALEYTVLVGEGVMVPVRQFGPLRAERRVAAADASLEALVEAISAALAEVLTEVAVQVEASAEQAAR